mmetsp:Transcript_26099/g.66260  ORF Transcript_26099/g.66260 Transcript_26099/m.66260 type:complete len:236 (-) Transcript_26099:92-799(-)
MSVWEEKVSCGMECYRICEAHTTFLVSLSSYSNMVSNIVAYCVVCSCRKFIEKNGGCQHMTCHCGTQFCWVCGREWGRLHDWSKCHLRAMQEITVVVRSVEMSAREAFFAVRQVGSLIEKVEMEIQRCDDGDDKDKALKVCHALFELTVITRIALFSCELACNIISDYPSSCLFLSSPLPSIDVLTDWPCFGSSVHISDVCLSCRRAFLMSPFMLHICQLLLFPLTISCHFCTVT